MKFSRKMWIMINLKATENYAFTVSLENTLFEKLQDGGQIAPRPEVLGVSENQQPAARGRGEKLTPLSMSLPPGTRE